MRNIAALTLWQSVLKQHGYTVRDVRKGTAAYRKVKAEYDAAMRILKKGR